MENADKKIKLLIICFQSKFVDILLSFFLWASLYVHTLVALMDNTQQQYKKGYFGPGPSLHVQQTELLRLKTVVF